MLKSPYYNTVVGTPLLSQLILLLLIAAGFGYAKGSEYREIAPEEMPNVQVANRNNYVSDPDRLLSASARSQIDQQLDSLRRATSCEVAVAIVPDLGDYEIEDYSEKVFTRWGIGKKDKDNGVLLIISPGSRRARIQTGYGAEGALPDMVCDLIIRQEIVPAMQKGDLDGAATGAVDRIAKVLSDPQYAEELKSAQSDASGNTLDTREVREAFMVFLASIAAGAFLLALIYALRTRSRLRNSSDYHKAEVWRSKLMFLGILAVLSALAALPVFLYALYSYRHNRNHSRKCTRCGARMQKLDEQTDNEYLDPSQDLEEKLGSIDYDVWLCPHCGEVEKYPFKEPGSAYGKCPRCGTHAYHMVCDRVLTQPTTRHAGRGVKVWKCEYCGLEDHKDYTIPRKESEAALLGTAAALGAMSRGHGSSGGGFGGGFGGGMTGGGGASGGW